MDDADLLIRLPRRPLIDREETAQMGMLDGPKRFVAKPTAQDFAQAREEGRHVGTLPPPGFEVAHILPLNPQPVEQLAVELYELRNLIEAEGIMLVGVGVVVQDDTEALQRPGQGRGTAAVIAGDENGVRQGDPLKDTGRD